MSKQTLYQHAAEEMGELIRALLDLSVRTNNFKSPPEEVWRDDLASRLLLGGLGYHIAEIPSENRRPDAWLARSAVIFSIEQAATGILYERLQPFINSLIETAFEETKNFSEVSAEWIYDNPHLCLS